ncbi:MAG TPA: transglutaminase domain-containing protein, partial [Ktedonobacterales bacterium]|nr:transglutaminase domain-containing protein [Ktedonobacterales bacterium]
PGAGQFNFFDTSLPLTSNVNLSHTQILHYSGGGPRDDPSQYLIAQTLNSYDGVRSWSATATASRLVAGNQSLKPSTAYARQNVYQVTFDVTWGGAGNASPAIFAPGSEPASFSLPSDVFFDSRSGVPITWHSTRPLLSGESYRARGYVSTATIQQLESTPAPGTLTGAELTQHYPAEVLALYLPENTGYIPQVIKDAAVTATKGSTSMYDAAIHLQNYLRAGFTYSQQNNPDIPGNEDAMTWFFQNKKGFCTFFATAMALMGRSLGLPTRIAEGFSVGAYDTNQRAYVVRGTDTHAWTQIYFGKYGWIDFEPTASFPVFGRAIGSSTGSSTPSNSGANGTAQAGGGPNEHQTAPLGGLGGAFGGSGDGPVVRVGLGLSFTLLLLLTLAAAFLLWWRLLYRALSPTAAAFARVTRLGAWAGAPPRSWQTPSEYADKLGEVLPEQRESLRKLSELYAQERWGGGLTRATAADLRRLYDQVRVAATGAIVRRARQLPTTLANALRRIRRSG